MRDFNDIKNAIPGDVLEMEGSKALVVDVCEWGVKIDTMGRSKMRIPFMFTELISRNARIVEATEAK